VTGSLRAVRPGTAIVIVALIVAVIVAAFLQLVIFKP
jgi:hypothetical protein